VVDVRDGITPLDQEVARRLRSVDLPVILVANKAEGERYSWDVDSFRRLGFGEGPFAISAQNAEGLGPLYDRIVELIPRWVEECPADTAVMKLAVVGRRNAGKSTLINRLAREERMIVSEIPGTTRDAVDVIFERDGKRFIAIDTAGVRKRNKIQDAIEFYSEARSRKSIRRADVVLLLFDVTQKITAIDKNLARYVVDHHKPVILGANKWDQVKGRSPSEWSEYLASELPGINYAPVNFLSAKDGWRVDETLTLASEMFEQASQRIATSELNRVVKRALEARSPSATGYRVRVRYATQTDILPPTFVLFVNDKRLLGKDYVRYLENRLRKELPFNEVPLRLVLRDSKGVSLGD
jgi:GTP-binding protein